MKDFNQFERIPRTSTCVCLCVCVAPQDANWIALNSSLQCQSLSDIFLLFKSSDFITYDLTQP